MADLPSEFFICSEIRRKFLEEAILLSFSALRCHDVLTGYVITKSREKQFDAYG